LEGSLILDTPSASPEKISEKINWMVAIDAAESKKARDVKVLDLREVTSFTDYFVICSSASARQGKAIADEIGKALKKIGELPVSAEGYDSGDWILLDYGDFIVHIFSETARSYYDLERLWRHARSVEYPVVEKAS
jgi:ribosome-associated protein